MTIVSSGLGMLHPVAMGGFRDLGGCPRTIVVEVSMFRVASGRQRRARIDVFREPGSIPRMGLGRVGIALVPARGLDVGLGWRRVAWGMRHGRAPGVLVSWLWCKFTARGVVQEARITRWRRAMVAAAHLAHRVAP